MLRAGASPCRAPAVWCVDIRTWGHYLAVSPAGQSVCLGVPSLISVLCRFSHMPISTCMAARRCDHARVNARAWRHRTAGLRSHAAMLTGSFTNCHKQSPARRPAGHRLRRKRLKKETATIEKFCCRM